MEHRSRGLKSAISLADTEKPPTSSTLPLTAAEWKYLTPSTNDFQRISLWAM
jgi:hypothetical protein